MNSIFRTFVKTIPGTFKNIKQRYALNISKSWYGDSTNVTENDIRSILQKHYPEAKKITVEDTSGGCGAMFNIFIETKDFKGLTIPNQHKSVYNVLKEQIKKIHGLHVETKVPK